METFNQRITQNTLIVIVVNIFLIFLANTANAQCVNPPNLPDSIFEREYANLKD
mgnify:CR=1 FL=1